ncbi:hypothetical protein HC928_26140 [bacterium]|nr:hypothetical protein [bacterium]
MIQFLLRRLPRTALTLLGVVTITFLLGRVTGDPVAMLLPQTATLEDYERIRASLGLDQPCLCSTASTCVTCCAATWARRLCSTVRHSM